MIVPRVRTPIFDKYLRNLVDISLEMYEGYAPDRPRLILLTAQLAFEHGAGIDKRAPPSGRACWNLWNYNFGNRRGSVGDVGQYRMSAPEIDEHGKEYDLDGLWPAYSNADAGITTWLAMLERRWPTAWKVLDKFDGNRLLYATNYAEALRNAEERRPYYTTSVRRYALGLFAWYRILDGQWRMGEKTASSYFIPTVKAPSRFDVILEESAQ